jgi:hypothetical protein
LCREEGSHLQPDLAGCATRKPISADSSAAMSATSVLLLRHSTCRNPPSLPSRQGQWIGICGMARRQIRGDSYYREDEPERRRTSRHASTPNNRLRIPRALLGALSRPSATPARARRPGARPSIRGATPRDYTSSIGMDQLDRCSDFEHRHGFRIVPLLVVHLSESKMNSFSS